MLLYRKHLSRNQDNKFVSYDLFLAEVTVMLAAPCIHSRIGASAHQWQLSCSKIISNIFHLHRTNSLLTLIWGGIWKFPDWVYRTVVIIHQYRLSALRSSPRWTECICNSLFASLGTLSWSLFPWSCRGPSVLLVEWCPWCQSKTPLKL